MSLFESASLVVTPNGTKASKLYAIKPTDGSGDLSVVRATTATRVNSAGLIESVASNVPRLDYTNGTCPSILVEPQRTNVITNSNDFSNTTWADDGTTTRTPNSGISPDGTQNAIKITSNGGYNYRVLPVLSAGTYTYSIYVKASAAVNINIAINDVGGSGGTTKNIAVTTNWQRFNITKNVTLGTFVVIDYSSLQSGFDFYFYGAQIELSSYPTSYIPTTSASVTRNADVISKTGISSLIGQTEGTILIDFVLKNPLAATNRIFSLTETDWLNGGSIRLDITISSFVLDIAENTATSAQITYNTTPQQNTRYKVAIAYKQNDCKLFINGIDAGSDASTIAMPTCSELYLNALGGGFNAPYEASNINVSALWKTRLSNTELAQLTTL